MSSTIPTPITDKNGKSTTVHKKPEKTIGSRSVKAPVAPKSVNKLAEASEYYGGVKFTQKNDTPVAIDHRSLSDVITEINNERRLFIGDAQVQAIGREFFGADFDYKVDNSYGGKALETSMGQYKKFLEAVTTAEVDNNLLTENEAYHSARNGFFLPAAEGGWTQSGDDSFDAGWSRALEFADRNKFNYELENSSRGRADISWDEKFEEAALMDVGTHVRHWLGIQTLAPTGDHRRDWHETDSASIVLVIGRILDANRMSVNDQKLGGIVRDFLGNGFSADYAALEADARTKHLVNVQDLREMFAEIAVANR